MGIVYEYGINGHDSVYFSVDRMGRIQYNTNVCGRRGERSRYIFDRGEKAAHTVYHENIFAKGRT